MSRRQWSLRLSLGVLLGLALAGNLVVANHGQPQLTTATAPLITVLPQIWEADGDVVVSWGLYNPLDQWIRPGTFVLELLDEDEQVLARTAGAHLLGGAVMGPGQRAVEFGRFQGMAGKGQHVHLRMFPTGDEAAVMDLQLELVITDVRPYWGGQAYLEVQVVNKAPGTLEPGAAWVQAAFVQRDLGVVGTRPLHWGTPLAVGESRQVSLVTGPLPPGITPATLCSLDVWTPAGVRIEWQLGH